MANIKIQKGDRIRECHENDLGVFEKLGFKAIEAKKAPKKADKKPASK